MEQPSISWGGLGWNQGDYTPFAVVPQVSAPVYDTTQLYAPGPSRFSRTGQVQAELDVFELWDVPNSYPGLHSILLGLLAEAMGSLESGWMVSHAIMPALIWAVLFWNACRFVRSASLALAIAWAVCFIPFGPRRFLLLGQDRFKIKQCASRDPGGDKMHGSRLCQSERELVRACGPIPYYFYWIAFFVGAGSLLIVAAIIKRWDYVKTVASVLVLGCLTGIRFLLWTNADNLSLFNRGFDVGPLQRNPAHAIFPAIRYKTGSKPWLFGTTGPYGSGVLSVTLSPVAGAAAARTAFSAALRASMGTASAELPTSSVP